MSSKKLNISFVNKRLIASTLLQYYPFSNDELDELLKKSVIRNFKKKQAVLAIGEVERYISIIHRGTARKYLVDHHNREITTEISGQYEVMCSNASIGKVTPTFYAIQAIDDLMLISFTLEALRELYLISPVYFEFGKKIVGQSLSKIEEREILLAKYDATKRFQQFIEKNHHFYERIPQKYLASYLNIRPQTLSKIKKKYIDDDNPALHSG